MHRELCQKVIHYLDNYLLIESPKQAPDDLQKLMADFSALNIPVAVKKVEGPATALTLLGITLDTQSMQASLPADKLVRIRDRIHAFTISQACFRKELQPLLGMLNFAMRIIPPGRPLISRLLALLPIAPTLILGSN